jgi:uncharacterized membrane protein YqjE
MPDRIHAEPSHKPGFFSHAAACLATLLEYFRVRLELAGMESREAAVHGAILLGLAAGGLVALVFGYFFFCLGLVFLIALAFDGGNAWIWVLLGMALVHFGGAVGLGFWAKAKLKEPMFSVTLDELRKDQEWLMSIAGKKR